MHRRTFTFCRLHLITWLVMAGLGGVFYYVQTWDYLLFYLSSPDLYRMIAYGWPLHHLNENREWWEPLNSAEYVSLTWHPTALAVNLWVCGSMLFSTAYLTERWIRSRLTVRFSLSSILILTAATAATLTLLSGRSYYFQISYETLFGVYHPDFPDSPIFFPIPIHIVLTVILIGTFYTYFLFFLRFSRSLLGFFPSDRSNGAQPPTPPEDPGSR